MVPIRQKINTLLPVLRRLPKKYYFIIGILLVMAMYIVAFRQQTLMYSYSGRTCSDRLVLFPGMFSQAGSGKYKITPHGGWKVAGHKMTATSLCMLPVAAPAENSSETLAFALFGSWVARFTYRIETKNHPKVDIAALNKPIPASRELVLPLSEPDATFSYKLEVDDGQASCKSVGEGLVCDVPGLKLKQGSAYTATLEKYFKDEAVGEVASTRIETLSPLSIAKSSIEKDAVVYDRPKSIMLTMDKPLKQAKLTAWRIDGEAPVELGANTEFDGQELTLTFGEDLPRQATIGLKVVTLEATDGSTPLDDEYILAFKTSGGPRVTGVNVGSSGVAPGAQIIVSFDQDLAPDQDLGPLVAASGGVTYQARRGNQLVFSTNGVERCATISIVLKPEIASPYGVSGQSGWQYSGRIRCYTISTIGYSSQGRAITAYHFGDSGPSVMYTGAIHGSEASTKYLMDRWIQELDANPGKIPSGKRVIVVPVINPDGFAAGRRLNARNVDLNRNFAVSDWKKDIEDINGNAFPGGGGTEPMSEPETKALASFVAQQRPELVISYHSIGGMVISNQAGQANARTSQYASLSGYWIGSGDGSEFGYQITGTADDYYREKLGIASIVIELGSHSYHQFERNQSAMWAMMR